MHVALVAFLVLGAAGLYLAMPGGRRISGRLALLVLTAAAGTLMAVVLGEVADPTAAWFLGLSLVALFAGIRVITHRRPVYSALYFVLLVAAVTGLLLLMQAEFLALALVIVYAGAIIVTYVFVIMLAQQARPASYDVQSREPFWGCLAGFVLLTLLAGQFFDPRAVPMSQSSSIPGPAGTVELIGTRLFSEYVIAVQIAGLLLLAALVGAIAIARRRRSTGEESGGETC